MLEQTCQLAEQGYNGVEVGESLVNGSNNGVVKVLLTNSTGITQKVEKGTYI